MRSVSRLSVIVVLCLFVSIASCAQLKYATDKKCFAGSTLFVLGNFIPDDPNPPGFFQFNFGYRLNPKNTVSVEVKTWKYAWPLGIPYGDAYNADDEKYPGDIREYGIAFAYQHFWWKGMYTAVHAMNTLQKYKDEDGKFIKNGYQLFMTYRLGYHVSFWKNRLFLEPSIAVTNWPIKSKAPDGFALLDDKWPRYFLFEPGLHFGFNF